MFLLNFVHYQSHIGFQAIIIIHLALKNKFLGFEYREVDVF